MKNILLKAIKIYQMLPLHTHTMCRFTPTCSEYMKQSIDRFGTYNGLKLGTKRILKCHPFGKYGYDPVPEKIDK